MQNFTHSDTLSLYLGLSCELLAYSVYLMARKAYQLIEHTADIGIRVRARDLKGLFRNAAAAMFDIIGCKLKALGCKPKKIKIKLNSSDLDELFVNWLNELLSLSSAKELVFCDFQIRKLDKNNLEATVTGQSAKNYNIDKEVKAATYHQLKIEQSASGWQAKVIFDV